MNPNRSRMKDSAYPISVGPNDSYGNGMTKAEHVAVQVMTSLIATGRYDLAIDDHVDNLKFHTRCAVEALEEMFETL